VRYRQVIVMLLNEFLKEEADWLPIHRFDNKAPITPTIRGAGWVALTQRSGH
jgi:hypothetical protein